MLLAMTEYGKDVSLDLLFLVDFGSRSHSSHAELCTAQQSTRLLPSLPSVHLLWGTLFLPRAVGIFITSLGGHTKLST